MNAATEITTNNSGNGSSCIERATFDPGAGTLDVVFLRSPGTAYTFYGVTASEWARLSGAASLGKVWNDIFRGSRFTKHATRPLPVALAA